MCVFVSPLLIPSSTNRRVDDFHPTRYLSHSPAGIFYCMPRRKIIKQQNVFVPFKQNNSEGFIGVPYFVSFKKRPNISLYVEYSRTLRLFFKDVKFA